ncbi:Gfo/Idh/MocA family protein [Sphingomonas nostoxanthinifaciens]|uniref:Gfo/Idh/MocA family protein n=1 Tax=Sphingomonas nostoxanthinifaciens TaxID=2872652 RepID=UPI001CC206A6|nr:Gfo/Idh/MocA family oxidoreductase [Sphingomonas nostoxanthinifaciens]UAK26130.1 Gfo/Idh/MocA family oxidoreductase [Sphingomonas nostoxanthinifaciens]
MPLRVGIVGLGKIARDQHLPAIAASPDLELAAIATRAADPAAKYSSIAELLAGEPDLDAVALCQPPQARFDAARTAIAAGKHVFLEKPPGTTLGEVAALAALADAQGVTLFASWHSRYASGVEAARSWLAGKTISAVSIEWKEDVRHWHPGQDWIWQPGGFGVFDPGINALSIATAILPDFFLLDGTMLFPANRAAPIAADLRFRLVEGAPVRAVFDWRQTGPQTWDITVETGDGTLTLGHGGNTLAIDGAAVTLPAEAEYPNLYRRFVELVRAGESDVDVRPLRHVADAFLACTHERGEAFD